MAKRKNNLEGKDIHFSHKLGISGIIAIVLTFAVYLGGTFGSFLQTSVVGYPTHAPFDGTVAPVKKVPNWVAVNYDKTSDTYTSFSSNQMIDLPKYDAEILKTSTDSLVWGNAAHDAIRNAKLTYSVPYLGNYRLDGVEGGGSHPAVDIRVPMNTPVYAIANGTVVKVSSQESGFGHHIVIEHDNFPTLENPNAKETIYSSYSHLGNLIVSEGDVVKKGQQIALSGTTGTSTTPHIHFQIDNSEAPWHPFWPFSWAEVSEAGLDFYSAINESFNQDKARSTTINPMMYVQKYADGNEGTSSNSYVAPTTTSDSSDDDNSNGATADSYVPENSVETPVVETEVAEVVEVAMPEPIVKVEPLDPPELRFDFAVRERYYIGQNAEFKVLLRDQYGNVFPDGFAGEVVVKSSRGHVTSQAAILKSIYFDKNSEFATKFKRLSEGKDRLEIKYDGETYYSDWFEVVSDDDGKSKFSDLPVDNKYYEAISYLLDQGVVAGYPDGTFRPEKAVSRVEALKFIYEGIKATTKKGKIPFPDVSAEAWYGKYLYTAYSSGVVTGYPDGTFRPTNVVNKAEFYKLLFNGMGVNINQHVNQNPFKDVSKDEWFAPYVAYAKQIGVIDSDVTALNASEGMTRGEVAYAIYKLMKVMK